MESGTVVEDMGHRKKTLIIKRPKRCAEQTNIFLALTPIKTNFKIVSCNEKRLNMSACE